MTRPGDSTSRARSEATPPSFVPDGTAQQRQYAHARNEALRRHLRVRALGDLPCSCAMPPSDGIRRPLLAFAVTEPATGSVSEVVFTGMGLACSCAPTVVWCEHMLAVILDMQPGDSGLQYGYQHTPQQAELFAE